MHLAASSLAHSLASADAFSSFSARLFDEMMMDFWTVMLRLESVACYSTLTWRAGDLCQRRVARRRLDLLYSPCPPWQGSRHQELAPPSLTPAFRSHAWRRAEQSERRRLLAAFGCGEFGAGALASRAAGAPSPPAAGSSCGGGDGGGGGSGDAGLLGAGVDGWLPYTVRSPRSRADPLAAMWAARAGLRSRRGPPRASWRAPSSPGRAASDDEPSAFIRFVASRAPPSWLHPGRPPTALARSHPMERPLPACRPQLRQRPISGRRRGLHRFHTLTDCHLGHASLAASSFSRLLLASPHSGSQPATRPTGSSRGWGPAAERVWLASTCPWRPRSPLAESSRCLD